MAIRYERAPIVEAIIEIQVPSDHGVGVERIDEALSPLLNSDYPKKSATSSFQGQLRVFPNPGSSFETAKIGFDFRSQDGKQVFMAHTGRFAFSRLAPYGTWNDVKAEAQRLWTLYRSIIPVEKASRLAVRYVNKIDFPAAKLEFHEYLKTYPHVTTGAPDLVTNFFMRLEIPQPDIAASTILVLASAPGQHEDVSMILDIDVFKNPAEGAGITEIWEELELLRERKNLYFESAITDATRRLFGKRTEY